MDKFKIIYNAVCDTWSITKKYIGADFSKDVNWNKLIKDFEVLKSKYRDYHKAEALVGAIAVAIINYLDDTR